MMPICSGFWRGGESWWNKNAVLFIKFLFIKNRWFGICKCCVSRICSWQYCCSTIVGGWLFLGSVLHFCPSRNQSGGFLWCYVVILWCPSVMGFGGPVNLGTRMLLFLFGISKSCGCADIGCKLTSVINFVLGLVVEGIWCTRTGITTEQVCALSSSLPWGSASSLFTQKYWNPNLQIKNVCIYPMLLLVMCADGCNITKLIATSLRLLQCMCGCLWKARKSCWCKNVQIARTHGQGYGTFPAPATSRRATLLF